VDVLSNESAIKETTFLSLLVLFVFCAFASQENFFFLYLQQRVEAGVCERSFIHPIDKSGWQKGFFFNFGDDAKKKCLKSASAVLLSYHHHPAPSLDPLARLVWVVMESAAYVSTCQRH
jgi:hypothetical protein